MRSNCIVWALYMWCRFGGYFALRRSRLGPFWHAIWSRDLLNWYAYVPLHPHRRWFPAPLFRGRVAREIPPGVNEISPLMSDRYETTDRP